VNNRRTPTILRKRLRILVIGAPDRRHPLAGDGAAFPHINARSGEILDDWLHEMTPELSGLIDSNVRLWRDIWMPHGGDGIKSLRPVAEIVKDMARDYRAACAFALFPASRVEA